MKGLLLFLALAVACVSAHDAGLRVKFNIGLRPGTDFFFDIPKTIARAILEGWYLTQRPAGPRASLVLYCPADRVLCAYYDDNGFVAGLQIALDQDQFTDAVFDWEIQGFVEWVPVTASGDLKKYWVMRQYFVSEEYLEIDAAERYERRNASKTLQEDAVWLHAINGQVDKLPGRTVEIEQSIYTRQACIIWMGRHFYYNMTTTTPCTSEGIYPWFPLAHSGFLVGTGFMIYGKLPIVEGQRDWFERPSKTAVQTIVPTGPTCLYELAENVGLVTMHIYYIEKPWVLGCLFN